MTTTDRLADALMAAVQCTHEHGGQTDHSQCTRAREAQRRKLLELLAAGELQANNQANTCTHGSATGVDQASGPDKVWRCDHCGMRWREDGGPITPPSVQALRDFEPCQGGDELHEHHLTYCVPFYEMRRAALADPAPGATS